MSRGAPVHPATSLRLTPLGLSVLASSTLCVLVGGLVEGGATASLLGLGLLVFLGIAALAGRRALSGLAITRRYEAWSFAGDYVPVEVTITNTSGRRVTGLTVEEALVPAALAERLVATDGRRVSRWRGDALFVLSLGPGEHVTRTLHLFAPARGEHRFARTVLATTFPGGLWRRTRAVDVAGGLLVYPAMGTLQRDALPLLCPDLDRRYQPVPASREHEVRGVRAYRRGDSPRWIHWRSTARHGQLMVKEFERPAGRRVVLVVDARPPRLYFGTCAELEEALSFVATATRALARRGCEVTVAAGQRGEARVAARVSSGAGELHRAMELLARLRLDRQGDLDATLGALHDEDLRDAQVVIVHLDRAAAPKRTRRRGRVEHLVVGGKRFARAFTAADVLTEAWT